MAGAGRLAGMYAALFLLFIAVGWLIGTLMFGNPILGTVLFLGLAIVFNAVSYFLSDRIVLKAYKARIVTEKEAPRLYRIVARVAKISKMPMPRVAIVPSPTPNAFATGRNPKRAVVAATDGIMKILDDRELTGVLAHEIAHVKDRDVAVVTVAATVAGAIAFATRMFFWSMLFGGARNRGGGWPMILLAVVAMILAPIAAMVIQMAISRSREYKADRVGAKNLRAPGALADALEKLEYANRRRPIEFGNPSHASLFIVNPFKASVLTRLFTTHPPIRDRVKRLRKMAREMGV
jgi:heat shock protein HtpX